MVLLALGLNHQTAPLQLREKFSFGLEEADKLVIELQNKGLVNEAILISTCNRTELYGEINTETNEAHEFSTLEWLAKYRQLSLNDIQPYSYRYTDLSAVQHLLRVAIGLDSMVLGEVEILGQIKTAYRRALEAGTLGRSLDRLFQFTFSVAKQVRYETGIGVNPVSIARLAVRLANQIFSNLKEATVLLVGAGNLIRLAAFHLQALGQKKILLANRSRERLNPLAALLNAEVLSLEDIPHRLHEADIVMTGTTSVLPILGKGMVESALKRRKHRPIYMVDLAVPRDIEPEVGTLEDVYLYNLDDLKNMAEENLRLRQDAALQAEDRISLEAEQFMGWLRSKPAFDLVKSLRQKYQDTQLQILKAALQQLQLGKSPEIVLQHALHGLTNRLLHSPTLRLRQAGMDEDWVLLALTKQLFDLNDENFHTN
jgi:glutamyl-tRNA reductase